MTRFMSVIYIVLLVSNQTQFLSHSLYFLAERVAVVEPVLRPLWRGGRFRLSRGRSSWIDQHVFVVGVVDR